MLLCFASLLIITLLIAVGVLLRNKAEKEFRRRHGIPEGCSNATANLFKAVMHRDVDGARKWVARGADINVRDRYDDSTLLIRWARVLDIYDDELRMEMVEALIQAGIDVNAEDEDGISALELFTEFCHRDVANRLIAAGARPDIFVAVALARADIAERLLDEQPHLINARKNSRSIMPSCPLLHYATSDPSDIRMAQFLLAKGADVHAKTGRGETPLHRAARGQCLQHAELYIQHGADVNLQDEKGNTPLHSALSSQGNPVIKLLLVHGADPNIKNKRGKTPLDRGPVHWYEQLQKEIRAESSMTE